MAFSLLNSLLNRDDFLLNLPGVSRFCPETLNPLIVKRIKVDFPEILSQLSGLENARVPELP